MRILKITVEEHSDAYVACPPGLKGVVIAEGDTHEEALAHSNPDSTTMPNHPKPGGPILRSTCTQAGIPREEFLRAYEQEQAIQFPAFSPARAPYYPAPQTC